ncbi:hypothetical protein QEH59_09580 [Coraliomargarita sp. SDUM461004]|uniref:Uncharacterized protein n=1 Tax=Thalassobacterium sedimentorum TaxID=3041258 RepID=A0ABU1ALM7_9BACT|nr:hypothetical protein [Coraliomargarita sp. SDUM461004]MDQ8194676.1 hypothetical protein [Coraliomargarita sp. SDUM461004]
MNQEHPQPSSNTLKGVRYSLAEMMAEVAIDRRDSVFGRELVDATEIEKMFGKQVRKKKKK